jgi:hypothetical protein
VSDQQQAMVTDCGTIDDLPSGWRGVLHDLGRNLGLVPPKAGERAAEAGQSYCQGFAVMSDNSKEAGE